MSLLDQMPNKLKTDLGTQKQFLGTVSFLQFDNSILNVKL